MKEIKAPNPYIREDAEGLIAPSCRALFLAGGLSNCPDWQSTVPQAFAEDKITLLNPRRDNFDVTNPLMEQEQIEWEHLNLLQADAYMFWFCAETVCPITLFELGKVAGLFPNKPLFVGAHAKYSRKRDINFQMLLMRPEIQVVHSLVALLVQIKEWVKQPFHPS